MAESIFAWVCIILAWIHAEPMWAVASALFALSLHLERIAKGCGYNG